MYLHHALIQVTCHLSIHQSCLYKWRGLGFPLPFCPAALVRRGSLCKTFQFIQRHS